MKTWARRTAQLHGDLAELAELRDRWWWLVAAGAAAPWGELPVYVVSDAEPGSDTFIGYACPSPTDPVAHAIARAHAARRAIQELDGALPQQPLAVTAQRAGGAAHAAPSSLTTAAFVVGRHTLRATLAASPSDEHALATRLRAALAGQRLPAGDVPAPSAGDEDAPFVCVALGDEPLETARHGHRRAWSPAGGPWLGLGRAGGLDLVSTCHMIVDGFGHARLTARIAALTGSLVPEVPRGAEGVLPPALPAVDGAQPLAVAWRPIATGMRALPLAYALGCRVHALVGQRQARFSPTIQIPIAPGSIDDPGRRHRRVVPALTSVRFDGGVPEPFAAFAARTKRMLAREASGQGPATRLLAAARALPAPLVWKRRAIGTSRPRWLEPLADVLGGRGCVSRIVIDEPLPPACAVSSPARLATAGDPLGSCVLTVLDDGVSAGLTLCGDGTVAGRHELDALLASLPVSLSV